MCPRSHTSGLMSGECERSRSASLIGATSDSVRARAVASASAASAALSRAGGSGTGRAVRAALADLGRGQALVVAVVPFHEIGIRERALGHPGQLTRLARAAERAVEDERERVAVEVRRQAAGDLASPVGQRYVGAAGVPA